jgi:hypothetical protein
MLTPCSMLWTSCTSGNFVNMTVEDFQKKRQVDRTKKRVHNSLHVAQVKISPPGTYQADTAPTVSNPNAHPCTLTHGASSLACGMPLVS